MPKIVAHINLRSGGGHRSKFSTKNVFAFGLPEPIGSDDFGGDHPIQRQHFEFV